MNYSIDSPGKEASFSTVDANSAYRNAKIGMKDRQKASFTFYHGFDRLICMPFGLRNTPSSFKRTMDDILFTVK